MRTELSRTYLIPFGQNFIRKFRQILRRWASKAWTAWDVDKPWQFVVGTCSFGTSGLFEFARAATEYSEAFAVGLRVVEGYGEE